MAPRRSAGATSTPIRSGVPAVGPRRRPQIFSRTPRRSASGWAGFHELVERWSSRPNVMAWEIFSELNTQRGPPKRMPPPSSKRPTTWFGASTPGALRLRRLPIFHSSSGSHRECSWRSLNGSPGRACGRSSWGKPWKTLWESAANEIVSLHPYDADLDRTAAVEKSTNRMAPRRRSRSSSVSPGSRLPKARGSRSGPGAAAGLRHAIWAEIVSGAASARALYWEDGYAAFHAGPGLTLIEQRNELEEVEAEHEMAREQGFPRHCDPGHGLGRPGVVRRCDGGQKTGLRLGTERCSRPPRLARASARQGARGSVSPIGGFGYLVDCADPARGRRPQRGHRQLARRCAQVRSRGTSRERRFRSPPWCRRSGRDNPSSVKGILRLYALAFGLPKLCCPTRRCSCRATASFDRCVVPSGI